jgi:hypothetical protein
MSSSRSQEDTYEAQNDQRLDELHSKIRTLRGVRHESYLNHAIESLPLATAGLQVTSDIYDDAERQNLVLDETVRSLLSLCSTSQLTSPRTTILLYRPTRSVLLLPV